MIISATFSKPTKLCQEKFNRDYLRIRIKLNTSSQSQKKYSVEHFTEKQAFHSQMEESEIESFIKENAGITFKNCVYKTQTEEVTILANKKGEITKLAKKLKNDAIITKAKSLSGNRIKNYLLPEGTPIPFLVHLGIMTAEGKVISSKYDKFRQINRFLEFVNDIFPSVMKNIFANEEQTRPLRIADFGCGKSYLTFAVHYYLTQVKKINAEIIGLDLKEEVIEYCNKTAKLLNCQGLRFDTGNIAEYNYQNSPDIVITLHACDTATDYALDYAIKNNCSAILSVPCCQHEINNQLNKNKNIPQEFIPLTKYGSIKERFASLVTDALRAEYLEQAGYSVQILEFIDMEHTPKNILIRAVKKQSKNDSAKKEAQALTKALELNPTLEKLLTD